MLKNANLIQNLHFDVANAINVASNIMDDPEAISETIKYAAQLFMM